MAPVAVCLSSMLHIGVADWPLYSIVQRRLVETEGTERLA